MSAHLRIALELMERRASAAAKAQESAEREGRHDTAAHYHCRVVAYLEAADIVRDVMAGVYDPSPDLTGDALVDNTGGRI